MRMAGFHLPFLTLQIWVYLFLVK